jgi:hypothetical protein
MPTGAISGKQEKKENNVVRSSFLQNQSLSELKTFETITLIAVYRPTYVHKLRIK